MAEKIKDNSHRCPWCGNIVKPATNDRTISGLFTMERKCPFCNYHYCLKRYSMVRCRETIMPTKGFKSEINLFQKQSKLQFENDMVIPIEFIDDNGKAVSSLCCVRIENGKWSHGILKCDLRLLTFGDQPQETTDKIYLYNKGKIIADGNIICELDSGY